MFPSAPPEFCLAADRVRASAPAAGRSSAALRPFIVGGTATNDLAAQTSGAILNTTGGFSKIANLSQLTDICGPPPCGCGNGEGAGSYSLQMNTNHFKLGNNPSGESQVYQQFVYQTAEGVGTIDMEAWIENPGARCPAGPWQFMNFTYCNGTMANYCELQSPIVGAPAVSMADLQNVQMVGGFSGKEGSEGAYVSFFIKGDSQITLVSERLPADMNLYPGWTTAEFNVFGYGDGSVAMANPGASITAQVNIALANGSEALPSCQNFSGTAEQNSLNLSPPCCPIAAPAPGILVFETNVTGGKSPCQCGLFFHWNPSTATCQIVL
jgi:hypothetical protein